MPHQWEGCELEVLPGLEDIVRDEISDLLPGQVQVTAQPRPGRLTVQVRGRPWRLERLRSIVAVHVTARFDVPRPKALLGHQHFTRLVALLGELVARQAPGTFASLRVSAAGAESAVFTRLRGELERALGLQGQGEGDLLVSFRRPPDRAPGWEVLARTTPRPLSARAWRVCSLPGALNAAAAYAMVRMADPQPTDRFLNLACGSGTFLVERLDYVPASLALGVDVDPQALECARANLRAAGHGSAATLVHGDAARLPLASGSIDTMVVDLPFGMLMGSTQENRALYPALLAEAARVAAPTARLVAITAARRLFESALEEVGSAWHLTRTLGLSLPYRDRTMPVRIYLLNRA